MEEERKLFFTSDTWFYRNNVIKLLNRTRYNDIEEMDEDLVEKWNSEVGMDDVVFILGNYVYDSTKMDVVNSTLRGYKVLLPTNMDKECVLANEDVLSKLLKGEVVGFDVENASANVDSEFIKRKAYMSVGLTTPEYVMWQLEYALENAKGDFVLTKNNIVELPDYGIVLSNYPLLDWNGKDKGVINLHGGTMPTANLNIEKRFNVSVDCCGFKPISYDTIMKLVKKQKNVHKKLNKGN